MTCKKVEILIIPEQRFWGNELCSNILPNHSFKFPYKYIYFILCNRLCVSRLETYFPFLYKYLAHLINLFYFAQLNSLECRHRLTKRLYHRGSRTCGWPIDRSPKKGPWPRAEVTPHPLHRSAFATTWAGPRAGCWPEQELKTFQIFIGSKRPENWTFVLAGNVRYFWGKNYFQS